MTDKNFSEVDREYIEMINFYLGIAKDDSSRRRIFSKLDYCVYCGGLKFEGRCYCLADD